MAYAAPQILRDLADLVMPGREGLAILDLGCGTGLAGAMFQATGPRGWTGVDLSPAMIEKARARGIYDHLDVADLESALPRRAVYDLILAADTLVYLGDLAPLFRTLAPHIWRRMVIFFSPRKPRTARGSSLVPSAAGGIARPICAKQAGLAGFAVAGLVAASPRPEANQPVAGFAVALTRP